MLQNEINLIEILSKEDKKNAPEDENIEEAEEGEEKEPKIETEEKEGKPSLEEKEGKLSLEEEPRSSKEENIQSDSKSTISEDITDDSIENEDKKNKRREKSIRGKIFLFFETPSSSIYARIWAVFITIVIIMSVISFVLSSLPIYRDSYPKPLFILESVFIVIFTFEYLARLVTSERFWRWMIRPLNLADLIAILPYYIDFFISDHVKVVFAIRVIRIFRVFRILRIGRMSGFLKIFSKTLRKSRDALLLLLFIIFLFLLIFSSLMFYAEQINASFDDSTLQWIRQDGSISPFQSIPDSFWWCIVTITTVGYGDAFPITWAGKIIATMTMLSGIVFLAFPISIIGSNFNTAWHAQRAKSKIKKQRGKSAEIAVKKYKKGVKLRKIITEIANKHHEIGQHIGNLENEMNSIKEKHARILELIELTDIALKEAKINFLNQKIHEKSKSTPENPKKETTM